jgi:hypothetical protein
MVLSGSDQLTSNEDEYDVSCPEILEPPAKTTITPEATAQVPTVVAPIGARSDQQAGKGETTAESTAYAVRATSEIHNVMLDPTSFTVLQVIAITKQEKDGRTSFRGCVHYVGSNSFGGRMQRWGGYSVNKKGQLNSWSGTEYTDCYIHKNEVQTDVTAEVEK